MERSLLPGGLILVAVDAVPGTVQVFTGTSAGAGPHERRYQCLLLSTSHRRLILRLGILKEVVYHKLLPFCPAPLVPHVPHNSHCLWVIKPEDRKCWILINTSVKPHVGDFWESEDDFMVCVCVVAPAGL